MRAAEAESIGAVETKAMLLPSGAQSNGTIAAPVGLGSVEARHPASLSKVRIAGAPDSLADCTARMRPSGDQRRRE
jgi:hypothetical protein